MEAEATPTAGAAPADTEMDMLGLDSDDDAPAGGGAALPDDVFAASGVVNGHGGGNGTGIDGDSPVAAVGQEYASDSQPASPQPPTPPATSFPANSVFFNAAKRQQGLL
jgi:hypothetical protein